MTLACLARSVEATTRALTAAASVKHLIPAAAPLQRGVEALRRAHEALGWPPLEPLPSWLPAPPPRRRPTRRRKKKAKPRARRRGRAVEELELAAPSAWDPDPLYEASRCQALLLEVIRRAIHDWVLYRQHRRWDLRERAHAAYVWLFEEEPGHPQWERRQRAEFEIDGKTVRGGRALTSFLAICEAVSLSPETVRERARTVTVKEVAQAGRPPERRRASRSDSPSIEEHAVLVDVDFEHLEAEAAEGVSEYLGGGWYAGEYQR